MSGFYKEFCRRIKVFSSHLKIYWRLAFIILVPILLCPLPIISGTQAASCAYIVLIMVAYWVSEVLPMPVTSIIPLALFPLFGIVKASTIASEYLKDSHWVFMGSLMMALAVEKSQLHHRVGLLILTKIGSSPRRLMLGFMVSTCFLSMWMSNTATTAMMVPLAVAVIEELTESTSEKSGMDTHQLEDMAHQTEAVETVCRSATASLRKKSSAVIGTNNNNNNQLEKCVVVNERSSQFQRIRKGLLLSICYAANIGGTGTLTGTTPNLVLMGQLHSMYQNKDTGLNYATWMAFSMPELIVILVLAWLWLQALFIGTRGCRRGQSDDEEAIRAVLMNKYKGLKPISFAEKVTLCLFTLLILLWLFRDPGFITGWGHVFPKGEFSRVHRSDSSSSEQDPTPSTTTLLTWENMQKEFPWGILILLGGGYAMAAGVKNSGLDIWISKHFSKLSTLPTFAFVVICVVLVTFLTEFSSNVAIASIFIPIGASVAEHMHINPLYVVLPIAVASSFAFMLPVATPPNAIVFGTGIVPLSDMAVSGIVMNIICMLILLININTYGCWLLQCQTYPHWAERGHNASFVVAQPDYNVTFS